MKKIILTLLIIIPKLIFCQNYQELDSVSAENIYYSTNKKFFITKYMTKPEHSFVLSFKDSIDYDYIYFSSKSEISGLIYTIIRSIEKQKDITYRSTSQEFTITPLTNNISKVRVGDQLFSIDKSTLNKMISKFQQI